MSLFEIIITVVILVAVLIFTKFLNCFLNYYVSKVVDPIGEDFSTVPEGEIALRQTLLYYAGGKNVFPESKKPQPQPQPSPVYEESIVGED